MSEAPRIVLRPNPGISADPGQDARARAWSFIFSCHAKKEASKPARNAHPGRPTGSGAV